MNLDVKNDTNAGLGKLAQVIRSGQTSSNATMAAVRPAGVSALTNMTQPSVLSARKPTWRTRTRRCIGTFSLAVLVLTAGVGGAQAQVTPQMCGQIGGRSYGPFDYRTAGKFERNIVENAHFTPEVEALIRGKTNNHVGPDLSYTLNVFPNHHRALVAAVRLTEKLKTDQPAGMRTIECYFERALRFAREDLIVEGLYADWLIKKGRRKEAEIRIDQWLPQAADNPALQYSAGLLYLELGNTEKALAQAHRAEALGWPQKELAEQLRASGHWRDLPAATPAASAP